MSFELSPSQRSRLVICPCCYRLRDPGASLAARQRCRCEPRLPDEPVERLSWALCSCCGVEPVPSGFRFAPLHCDFCRTRVMALNRALGRCAIPVRAHSIMNGIGLSADESDAGPIERFHIGLLTFFEALDHLDKRACDVVRENLAELEFPPAQEIGLSAYLEVARGRIDLERAFERLCAHFASLN
jgi:hypothetical protein